MKNRSKPVLFSAFTLFFLLALRSAAASSVAEEDEDEKEFDYIVGGDRGPTKWGEIKEEWEACGKGEMQSPIDLSSKRVRVIPKTGEIERSYKPSNASVKNRGHDIRLRWDKDSAGSITINGTVYYLQQCHWHSPSEHTIDGIRYALELHMVHTSLEPNVTNSTAVFGLLYKTGDADAFLDERQVGVIDPRGIVMGGRSYFNYVGSLTVPPCSEGVIWIINNEINNVSMNQVRLLRKAVKDDSEKNARPIQALNGREIRFFQPHHEKTSI
ncbi:hypothetical protein BT93_A1096 [Corymbia citriodora subsp. variegata]|nr:hypothetical protein BT93_A1096 [Corymbia citriodora subsp. variegata]